MSCRCDSDKGVTIVYSCSGTANTGNLADQVFRKLKAERFASGSCLSAIGADLSGYVASAEEADENIVFDGCPVSCGKKNFENKGIPCTQHFVTKYGVEKGKTDITPGVIDRVINEINARLGACNG